MTIYHTGSERELSACEQLVWCTDTLCSLNFAMHAELHGPLTEDRLRGALLQLQARHPLLRMRVSEEKGSLWFRTTEAPIPIRIEDVPVESTPSEAEHEVRSPFNTTTGPLVRSVWLRHAPAHHTVLITFHHAIGDGISGALLVRDLLRALSGELLPPMPLVASLDTHLPRKAQGWRGFLGSMRVLASLIGRVLLRGIPRAVPNELASGFEERRACITMLRFEPPFTLALAKRARQERTTLHGALSAAILLASFAEMGRSRAHVFFGSPVNLRKSVEHPIGDDVGFFVGIGVGSHVLRLRQDFWALAREVKQGLAATIHAGDPVFGLPGIARALKVVFKMFGGQRRGALTTARLLSMMLAPSLGLTNIGRLPIGSQYGSFEVLALGFVMSTSLLGTSGWAAATLGDTLCLNLVTMEPAISRDTQARLARRVVTLLEGAVGACNLLNSQHFHSGLPSGSNPV